MKGKALLKYSILNSEYLFINLIFEEKSGRGIRRPPHDTGITVPLIVTARRGEEEKHVKL